MSDIDSLIKLLAKLPGLGPRSARRAALHLIKNKHALMLPLSEALAQTAESIIPCRSCGNLDTLSPCHICADARRDASVICVVEEVADLWAIERGKSYNGLYHVLGGSLSAIDGVTPTDLSLDSLSVRAARASEIIIATNATASGQATAFYITEMLKGMGLKISRLAQGIPHGGELDYLDDGTLGAAFRERLPMAG